MAKRKSDEPLVSVVIPAYNEETNIRRGALDEVLEYLSQREYGSEVIVVDDGSADATAALVEAAAKRWPALRLLRVEHGGKASAVSAGVAAARGEHVVFTDMDQSTPIRYVDGLLAELQQGCDVVIGSRFILGAERLDEPRTRRLLGRAFSLLVRRLLLPDIRDSQCGFKGFRREVARELFEGLLVFSQDGPRPRGPRVTAFDVELLVQAKNRGYRVKEIPVTWRHAHTSRVDPVREGVRMFRQVLAVWINDRRGRYGPRGR